MSRAGCWPLDRCPHLAASTSLPLSCLPHVCLPSPLPCSPHAFSPLLLSIRKQHFAPSLSTFPFKLQLQRQHISPVSINGTSIPSCHLHGVLSLLTAQQFPRHEGYTLSLHLQTLHSTGNALFLSTQSPLDPTCSSQGQRSSHWKWRTLFPPSSQTPIKKWLRRTGKIVLNASLSPRCTM